MSDYYERDSFEKEDDWLRRQLECLIDTRVVFFTKGGIHTEGTIRRVKRDFVELIPTNGITSEPVEVESNDSGITLEQFLKFFIRINDIVGFGQETLGD